MKRLSGLARRDISRRSAVISLAVFSLIASAIVIFAFLSRGDSSQPVYRYFNGTDHFYTQNKTTYSGYNYEGIAFYADTIKSLGNVPVYRYYNNKEHFYTLKNTTYAGYNYEGIAFYTYPSKVSGSVPIYRYFNGADHFYTQAYTTYSGFTFEGIAFYAPVYASSAPPPTAPSPVPPTITATSSPIYRYFNGVDSFYVPNTGSYGGYYYEGVAFNAFASQAQSTSPIYRYFNGKEHFYTLNNSTYPGYNYEGVSFYAYPSQVQGSVPVYRYFNGVNHFYTTGSGAYAGYTKEGVAFNAIAATTSPTTPEPQSLEQTTANAILKTYTDRCPILAGTTVVFGDAQGYQALTYQTVGRIVISPTHTATIERLISHEIYHVYDWRDNNVINWGENVPPVPKPACMP